MDGGQVPQPGGRGALDRAARATTVCGRQRLSGLEADLLFVSPPLNGWVIVMGDRLPGPDSDIDRCFRFLTETSERVGHVQYFHGNPMLGHHAWAKVIERQVLRAYVWTGETTWNQGETSIGEQKCGMHSFDYFADDDDESAYQLWEIVRQNVEQLPLLASIWSVDPVALEDEAIRQAGLGGADAVGALGEKLADASDMSPDKCPNCGADVPPKAKACPECGACEDTGWAEDAGSMSRPISKRMSLIMMISWHGNSGRGGRPRGKSLNIIWVIVAMFLILFFPDSRLVSHCALYKQRRGVAFSGPLLMRWIGFIFAMSFLLAGCTTSTITNLTPKQLPRTATGLSPDRGDVQSNQRTLDRGVNEAAGHL